MPAVMRGAINGHDGPDRAFPEPRVTVARGSDGSMVLTSPEPLCAYPDRLTDRLFETAAEAPERVLIAQRDGSGAWRRLSYRDAARQVRRLAAALARLGLGPERPVMMLSGSSIEHALLAFAAMHAGIPYVSVTPAYSLLSRDFAKLKHVVGLLTPGLVFVDTTAPFQAALDAAVPSQTQVTSPAGLRGDMPVHDLTGLTTGDEMDAAGAGPDDVAKFLLTSGTTGMPKAVTVTHRMWCANQQMFAQALPGFAAKPPVFVDWLPWHHTSGGNQSIGMTLFLGGTLYIDGGKPTREGMAETVRNLREVAPSACFSVPKGFAELMPFLRADPAFARHFLSSISMFFYSGASLPRELQAEMDALSLETTGRTVPVLSAYGATETAPFALIANWPSERTGLAGLPMAGVSAKLVPQGGKYEIRVKGPMVTPGYWRQPELTARAFDADGWLCLGDAVGFVDPERPQMGLAFEGRLAEDFKLTTGTWVNVAGLRDRVLRDAGLTVRDVVVTGENRDRPGGLVFLSPQDANDFLGGGDRSAAELAAEPAIRARLQTILDTMAEAGTGSSTMFDFLLPMPCEPDAEAGEITDKGSISQRNVLANRSELVSRLYADAAGEGALVARRPGSGGSRA